MSVDFSYGFFYLARAACMCVVCVCVGRTAFTWVLRQGARVAGADVGARVQRVRV